MFEVIKAFGYEKASYPITIAELPSATLVLDGLLNGDERKELFDTLAFHPECGDVVEGLLKRIRKFRWDYGPRGKRRTLRVTYFFYDLNMPLYIVAVFDRGEVFKQTREEKMEILSLTDELIKIHSRDTTDQVLGASA